MRNKNNKEVNRNFAGFFLIYHTKSFCLSRYASVKLRFFLYSVHPINDKCFLSCGIFIDSFGEKGDMEQYNVPDEMKVNVDYSDPALPAAAKLFKPLVVLDGDSYCCIFGPDPQQGILGCGDSPKEALRDWDKHLRERVRQADKNDEVLKYIVETLQHSEYKSE